MAGDLGKKFLAEPDGALPQDRQLGVFGVPPKVDFIGDEGVHHGGAVLIGVSERHRRAGQAVDLVAQAGAATGGSTAGAIDIERAHKISQ